MSLRNTETLVFIYKSTGRYCPELQHGIVVWACKQTQMFPMSTLPPPTALKMEAVCPSETLVPTYKFTQHSNPEYRKC